MNMKKILLSFAAVILSVNINSSDLLQPADTKNMFVFYISHLFIPQLSSDSFYSERMFGLSISEANTIFDPVYFRNNGKNARIDVETTCISLFYSEKILYDIELSASVSFIRHWSGFLDGTIENFHSLPVFGKGLPNGGREYVDQDEMKIHYAGGKNNFDISNAYSGLSDPSVYLKKGFVSDHSGCYFAVALKPSIGRKVFINSNTFDLGLSFGGDYRKDRFYLFCSTAFVKFLGKSFCSDELEQNKNYISSLCVGGGYRISENTSAIVQFYVHSSIYDTGVKRIDAPTVCNTYAFRWRYSKSSVLQFDITEDTFTYATADISFNFKNETRF